MTTKTRICWKCYERAPDVSEHVLVRLPRLGESEVAQLDPLRLVVVQQRVIQLQIPEGRFAKRECALRKP